MHLGIAHHLGWAVAVTAAAGHTVVDRRRIELIEPGQPAAPVHHVGGPHDLHRTSAPPDDGALAALVAEVRASTVRATSAALDALSTSQPGRSPRSRSGPGRRTSPPPSPPSAAPPTRAAPTR